MAGASIDWPSWIQAAGSLIAIGVAVALPRLDRREELDQYRRGAMAAATYANAQIASIWVIAHNLADRPARVEDMVPELKRAAAELDGFPLHGAKSAQAVVYMRQLARCAEGASEAAKSDPAVMRPRSMQIGNYAHHLLVLIARELQQPEPPPPFSHDGVPPDIIEAVAATEARAR